MDILQALKEAKLISSLNNGNVVGFLEFCHLPLAILEYAAFDFEPSGHSKIRANLGHLSTISTALTDSGILMINYIERFFVISQQGLPICITKI